MLLSFTEMLFLRFPHDQIQLNFQNTAQILSFLGSTFGFINHNLYSSLFLSLLKHLSQPAIYINISDIKNSSSTRRYPTPCAFPFINFSFFQQMCGTPTVCQALYQAL